MTRSLAAIFHGAGKDLELRRIQLPEPRGAEVLVRVLACTLCGSDVHSFAGRREIPLPTILGHEIVGEIVSFGDAAERCDLAGNALRIGDRVTWSIVASCGGCFYCGRGLPQKCLASVKYGHEPLHPGAELRGGLAEHCLLAPGTAIVRLPQRLPLAVACPASCATATIAAALEAAGEVRDRSVCCFGAGMLGLTACAMLRGAGADQIVCVDVNPSRLTRAPSFGATHVGAPDDVAHLAATITENHGFDVVLELSGSPSAFETGWNVLRRGGAAVLVGSVFPARPVPMNLEQVVRRNITIHGVHNYAPHNLLTAVRFLSEQHRHFPFADLVTRWFPLPDAAEAFQWSRDSGQVRIGVKPPAG